MHTSVNVCRRLLGFNGEKDSLEFKQKLLERVGFVRLFEMRLLYSSSTVHCSLLRLVCYVRAIHSRHTAMVGYGDHWSTNAFVS
jgi:hypothetical protein